MNGFKSAYDRAQQKVGAVKEKAQEIEDLLATGQPEDEAAALDLVPALETAKAEADAAISLYQSLTDTERYSSEAAALLSPASEAAAKAAGEGKEMTRDQWEKLPIEDQRAFAKSGVITDKKE